MIETIERKQVRTASNGFEVYSRTNRPEMAEFIPRDARRILEVGCSVGNFGAHLIAERGVEVWGVEIDADAAEIAAGRLKRVFCGDFAELVELPEEYFDCVVFNDVLEHMVDPYAALARARRLLKDGGTVVASIPNVRYFDNIWSLLVHKNWEYVDTGILDRTHLRFFTARSIRAMFEGLGFDIEELRGINPIDKFDRRQNKKFRVLNALALGRLEDMRWLQFAVVATPSKETL